MLNENPQFVTTFYSGGQLTGVSIEVASQVDPKHVEGKVSFPGSGLERTDQQLPD